MRRAPRPRLRNALAALVLPAFAACRPGPDPVHLGVLAPQGAEACHVRFDPLAAALARELELPVVVVPAGSAAELVEEFVRGELDFVRTDADVGLLARERVPGALAVARTSDDPPSRTYFLARRDAPLVPTETLTLDLANLTFAFGPEDSVASRRLPELYLREASGREPSEFFATPPLHLESEDAVWRAVQDGTVQAGAIDARTFDAGLDSGAIDPLTVAVVWATPDHPAEHWTAHPSAAAWIDAFLDLEAMVPLQR